MIWRERNMSDKMIKLLYIEKNLIYLLESRNPLFISPQPQFLSIPNSVL